MMRINYIFICAISIAVVAWIMNFDFGFRNIILKGGNPGEFGDVFGIVNSAFSGLAFLGVVYSIILQRNELDTVREERDETRQIFKNQQINLSQQRFEATFFQLFNSFNIIADNMEVKVSEKGYAVESLSDKVNIKGRDVFEFYYKRVADTYSALKKQELSEYKDKIDNINKEEESYGNKGRKVRLRKIEEVNLLMSNYKRRSFERVYENFFHEYGDDVGRYFRSLYTILNFIEKSFEEVEGDSDKEKIDKSEKRRFYFKLLRAQLSQHEATFIVVNYLSKYTTCQFNALIEKYGMAKNSNVEGEIFYDFEEKINKKIYGTTNYINHELDRIDSEYADDPADRPDKY